jgi:membrane protein DedA with SNARE-associated domain
VIEARKHQIKFVWAYILGGALIAISVTFPLFLIARQLRMANNDPMRIRAIDIVLVAVFAIAVLVLVIWVDTA